MERAAIWKFLKEGERVVNWQMCRQTAMSAITSIFKPEQIIRGLCAGYDAVLQVDESAREYAVDGCESIKTLAVWQWLRMGLQRSPFLPPAP